MTARPPSAIQHVCRGGQQPRPVELSALSFNTHMDNAPSFAERIVALRQCAVSLRQAAELILAEVEHMSMAQQKFAARVAKKAAHREKAGR